MNQISLSPSTVTGSLGIMHLKRYWEKAIAKRNGLLSKESFAQEWNTDITLLAALGLGLEQTLVHLYRAAPDFDQFEEWILEINAGNIPQEQIAAFNATLMQEKISTEKIQELQAVLSPEDLAFWDRNGYVIVRNAISQEDCRMTTDLIYDFLAIDKNDPASWYRPHPARQGIMVQLFQHPLLEKNRKAPRIRAAYEQLWGRSDLWMNTDRVSFNPPETTRWLFPGPNLHWDVSLELPIPFGLQGLLYLADTAASQGAFTLVPGFHNRIEKWISSLPEHADPRTQNLYELGATPIAAAAGDFIIWHHALPHGSSPNRAKLPRIVQYINYIPVDAHVKHQWK